jgi:hypothetical protein
VASLPERESPLSHPFRESGRREKGPILYFFLESPQYVTGLNLNHLYAHLYATLCQVGEIVLI